MAERLPTKALPPRLTQASRTTQNPLLTYGHGTTAETGCSITGGAFYQNAYFYADYCGDWIRSFDPASGTSAQFASEIAKPVDLEVGK